LLDPVLLDPMPLEAALLDAALLDPLLPEALLAVLPEDDAPPLPPLPPLPEETPGSTPKMALQETRAAVKARGGIRREVKRIETPRIAVPDACANARGGEEGRVPCPPCPASARAQFVPDLVIQPAQH